AVAVGPITGFGRVAQVRDLDPLAMRHLPEGLARPGGDLSAIELEGDRVGGRLGHRRSSGKWRKTESQGFGAAWPGPQTEAPPGRYPLSWCPSCMPSQYSSMSCRAVIPAGATFTPGRPTRPETENQRRPRPPLRPWPANQSGPRSRISRIQETVSTLWIRV